MTEYDFVLIKVIKTHKIAVPTKLNSDGIMELREGDVIALPSSLAKILLKRNCSTEDKFVEVIE